MLIELIDFCSTFVFSNPQVYLELCTLVYDAVQYEEDTE